MQVPVFRSSRARLFVLVGGYIIAALPAPAQRLKMVTYSLTPPVGWTTTTQNVAKGGVAFLGPQIQDYAVNINVAIDPAPHETLAQYVGAMHRQLAKPKEMKLLQDGTGSLAGQPAHTMLAELHVTGHAEIPILWVQEVFAIHKDRAYIVTLTYPKGIAAASAKKYKTAFDKVVASFRWEQEPALRKQSRQ